MPLILGANSVSGYTVKNSLRFNSGSSDYLNRTPATTTNQRTYTISCWYKRMNTGLQSAIIGVNPAGASFFSISIDASGTYANKLGFYWYDGTTDYGYYSDRLFRDFSAWYHIVIAVDTTQATAGDRLKVYINGIQETLTAVYGSFTQNLDTYYNSNVIHYIGASGETGTSALNGYLSEFYSIDGQALTPSSFGETDFDTGIWKPKAYTGTYGTNGFNLQFKNSASLGTDSSGNGNNFTVNNLTSVDQSTDTPTNNFATMNPLGSGSNVTFTEGNLKPSDDGTTHASMKGIFISTIGVSKGKWYAEFKYDDSDCIVGIATTTKDYKGLAQYYLGQGTLEYGLDSNGTPTIYTNGSGTTYGSGSTASGDIVSVALDLDNNKLYFAKNGTYYNSGNPATNTNGHSITSGEYYFAGGHGNLSQLFANFGNPPYTGGSYTDGAGYGNFSYAVPSGYYALCTKNLADYG
jgi:hypothetical protein